MTIHHPIPAGQGRAPLPDIDLRKLFEDATGAGQGPLPTLINANGVFFLTLSVNDRAGIAMTIQRLIDMLDALGADPDLEECGDLEPNIGWVSDDIAAHGFHDCGEREDENENGGDVHDEPHGDDELEPLLGWSETCSQGVPFSAGPGSIAFMDDPESHESPLDFRRNGQLVHCVALRGVKPRQIPTLAYGEMAHELADGTIMRTFVTSRDGRVAPC